MAEYGREPAGLGIAGKVERPIRFDEYGRPITTKRFDYSGVQNRSQVPGRPKYSDPLLELEEQLGMPANASALPVDFNRKDVDKLAIERELKNAYLPGSAPFKGKTILPNPYEREAGAGIRAALANREPVPLGYKENTQYRGYQDTTKELEGLMENERIRGLWDDITANEELLRGMATKNARRDASDVIAGANFAPLMAVLDATQKTDLAKYMGPEKVRKEELAKEAIANLDNLQKNKVGLLNSLANMTKTKVGESGSKDSLDIFKAMAAMEAKKDQQAFQGTNLMKKEYSALMKPTFETLNSLEGVRNEVLTKSPAAIQSAAIWMQRAAGDKGAISNMDARGQKLVTSEIPSILQHMTEQYFITGTISDEIATKMAERMDRAGKYLAQAAKRKHEHFVNTAPMSYRTNLGREDINAFLPSVAGGDMERVGRMAELGYAVAPPIIDPVKPRKKEEYQLNPKSMKEHFEAYKAATIANESMSPEERVKAINEYGARLEEAYKKQQQQQKSIKKSKTRELLDFFGVDPWKK